MVGSYYYLATKSDWVYTSVYSNMFNRARNRFMQSQGFDENRVEYMQSYVEQLEYQLSLLHGKDMSAVGEDAVDQEVSK